MSMYLCSYWCNFFGLITRYVFNPSCTDYDLFKFLGVLFGVGMRTKKPLDLFLAPCMWKLIAGMMLTIEDLEEVKKQTSLYHINGYW